MRVYKGKKQAVIKRFLEIRKLVQKCHGAIVLGGPVRPLLMKITVIAKEGQEIAQGQYAKRKVINGTENA